MALADQRQILTLSTVALAASNLIIEQEGTHGMMTFRTAGHTRFLLLVILSIFIAACGGGGDTGTTNSTTTNSGTGTSGGGGTGGGILATGSYILSWDQVVDPNVTGYKLYYATSPYSSGAKIYTIDVGAPTTYQFTPSTLGLTAGTTVYFSVAAVGNGMESPLSDPVITVALQ